MPSWPAISDQKRSYAPDPKKPRRVRDKRVAKQLHARGVTCVLCSESGASLHHVYPRGQGGDDVRANLVGLCGHGTSGCHGLIENGDKKMRRLLGEYILRQRHDTVAYLRQKLGEEAGMEWLRRRLLV